MESPGEKYSIIRVKNLPTEISVNKYAGGDWPTRYRTFQSSTAHIDAYKADQSDDVENISFLPARKGGVHLEPMNVSISNPKLCSPRTKPTGPASTRWSSAELQPPCRTPSTKILLTLSGQLSQVTNLLEMKICTMETKKIFGSCSHGHNSPLHLLKYVLLCTCSKALQAYWQKYTCICHNRTSSVNFSTPDNHLFSIHENVQYYGNNIV
jgi:hypothetical protein